MQPLLALLGHPGRTIDPENDCGTGLCVNIGMGMTVPFHFVPLHCLSWTFPLPFIGFSTAFP